MFNEQMNIVKVLLFECIRNLLNADMIFNLKMYLHSLILINIFSINDIKYEFRLMM